jgi:hypothetical protein
MLGDLAAWLDKLTFADRPADEVTALVIAAITEWATAQGWRVYHRAPSVVRLPPPYDAQHSVIDVACARPTGPPVVIEVDRTDRQRTLDKLRAEAEAGRVAIWVRWGTGKFATPPPPVQLVTLAVTMRNRRYSRKPVRELPPPEHSTTVTEATPVSLLDPPDLAR